MFLNLIVTHIALEMHKDLTEIQSCIFPHCTNPELPESNFLNYAQHTLLFCMSQFDRNNQALKCDHHMSDLVSLTYQNEDWDVT